MLRLMMQAAPEIAVILFDLDERITFWSTGATRVFGYEPHQALGETAARLFVPEDVERGAHQQEFAVARLEGVAQDDRWHLRADGSRFWGSGFLVRILDAAGQPIGFGKVLRNRTDVREQLDLLRSQALAAQREVEQKDLLLATLAHELRNPLAPIASAVELVRATAPASEKLELALRIISRQTELLRDIVDDVLELARLTAGKVVLRHARVVLNDVVRDAIQSCEPAAAMQGQTLRALLPAPPIEVDGDHTRLHQVVVNLVENAVKFTPAGGRIVVKLTSEGDEAVLRVEDNGIGISPENMPRIFDLFTQEDAARQVAGNGLGIGLALVKDLVVLHGGSVQVRSDGPGKGSEFSVRLPLAPAPRAG
jgi:two-component system CheB/CheR fusion protein